MSIFAHPHNVRGPESTRGRGLSTPDIVRMIFALHHSGHRYTQTISGIMVFYSFEMYPGIKLFIFLKALDKI